jgi:hypothetical protein
MSLALGKAEENKIFIQFFLNALFNFLYSSQAKITKLCRFP